MKRVEQVRLYPTHRQVARLQFALDVTRELYNALLEQRREAYRRRGVNVGTRQQYAEITALRQPSTQLDGRLAAVYRECEDAVLHRLDLAFKAFFRRVKSGEKAGYPRFKPAVRWNQLEFPHGDRALHLDADQRRVSVPGIGSVRLRKGRTVPLTYGRAWIVRRNDRWYACFECERPVTPLPPGEIAILGIDRGVHVLAAASDGTLYRHGAANAGRHRQKIATHQRALEAATVRDAAGRARNRHERARRKAVVRLQRAKEREANARLDRLHKIARAVVNRADVIALEKLDMRNMTRSAKGSLEQPGRNVRVKAALNRRMLEASFGRLELLICEKAEEAARQIVRVDARFSSQECSRCGHVARESRRRRRYACVVCPFYGHADVNAALVIRGRAQLGLKRMPDAGAEPVTTQDAA